MDGNLAMANNIVHAKEHEGEPAHCERCEKNCNPKELWACDMCEQMISHCCQAEYNQFTQIDFNCCKSCAKNNHPN